MWAGSEGGVGVGVGVGKNGGRGKMGSSYSRHRQLSLHQCLQLF